MKNVFKLITIAYALLVFFSSCKKDEDSKTNDTAVTCIDADGNSYKTVKIGDQIWMAENLRTTKFNDGSVIPTYIVGTIPNYTPCYLLYDNDNKYDSVYGKLYDQNAIRTGKLTPRGWHIPSNEDWLKLITYLGGASVCGGKMKVNYDWYTPNKGASNSSGFSAYGAGMYIMSTRFGGFSKLKTESLFWSSTIEESENFVMKLYNDQADAELEKYFYTDSKYILVSVRCIKD